jgi:DNA-binding NarL/FixJ family response regulator
MFTRRARFVDRIERAMAEQKPITVAVGHFDDLYARGLRGMIEDDPSLQLVASNVGPAQLPTMLRTRRPQVTILDAEALGSPIAVRELAALRPTTHLLLLAARPSGVESAQLLAFGAAACLSKSTQTRDVLNAIHLASRGLQLAPRAEAEAHGGGGLLTPRETDVLAHLQRRRSNAQIAADLQISIETVRTHARHIYRKLGVGSRRELLAAPEGRSVSAH